MKVQLVIQISDDGQLSMEGVPTDAVVFYGVLEAAKDAYRSHHAKLALQRSIVPVAGMPLLGVPRNGR